MACTIPVQVSRPLEDDEWLVGNGTPGVTVADMSGRTLRAAGPVASVYVAIDHGSVHLTPSRPLWRIEKRTDEPSEHVNLALQAGADLARRRAQASISQFGW